MPCVQATRRLIAAPLRASCSSCFGRSIAMIVRCADYWGIVAIPCEGSAGFLLIKEYPRIQEVGGSVFLEEKLTIGDCSPIISEDGYAVGIQFGYLNVELDSLILQSDLVQRSENVRLTTRRGLSCDLIWRWARKDAKLPDVNGFILHSVALRASDQKWAIAIPFDMFKNDLWCDQRYALADTST